MHCDGLALRPIPGRRTVAPSFELKRTREAPMKTLISAAAVIALGLAAGGCSVLETKSMAHEDLKNAQGHVVGYKEMMRDSETGEEMTQIALFVPRFNDRGRVIGYEERVRGGSVMRDQDSTESVAVAQAPSIEDLIQLARLN